MITKRYLIGLGLIVPLALFAESSGPTRAERRQAMVRLTESGVVTFDPATRVAMKIPNGWSVANYDHGPGGEVAIAFRQAPAHGRVTAIPRAYYSPYSAQHPRPSAADTEAWLRHEVSVKTTQRAAQGFTDYVAHDDASFTRIAGHPALSWTAEYTRNGTKWTEYLTRIDVGSGSLLLFLQAPAAETSRILPGFRAAIQSVVIP